MNRFYKDLSDEQLMKQIIDGRINAFDEIVRRYEKRIVNYLYQWTADLEDAKDIAQDSFLKLFKYKDNFLSGKEFSPWFFSIVKNSAKDSLNKRKPRSVLDIYEMDEKELQNKDTIMNPDSEEDSELFEMKIEYIKKAFDMLDDSFREVILLRYLEGFEYERIAETLGIPVGTVKSRINRGREQLKKILKAKDSSKDF